MSYFTEPWRLSEDGYIKRVDRVLRQIQAERAISTKPFMVDIFTEEEWNRLTARWRARKKRATDGSYLVRFKSMPQENGNIIVIHDSTDDATTKTQVLSDVEQDVRSLLYTSLRTPNGKHTKSSRWFGQSYCGMRGNGIMAMAAQMPLQHVKARIDTTSTNISVRRAMYKLGLSRRNEYASVTPGIRFIVFERDEFMCQICGRSRMKGDDIKLHVDHKMPIAKGGKTELDNLWTLCASCNLGKSDRLVTQITMGI